MPIHVVDPFNSFVRSEWWLPFAVAAGYACVWLILPFLTVSHMALWPPDAWICLMKKRHHETSDFRVKYWCGPPVQGRRSTGSFWTAMRCHQRHTNAASLLPGAMAKSSKLTKRLSWAGIFLTRLKLNALDSLDTRLAQLTKSLQFSHQQVNKHCHSTPLEGPQATHERPI